MIVSDEVKKNHIKREILNAKFDESMMVLFQKTTYYKHLMDFSL